MPPQKCEFCAESSDELTRIKLQDPVLSRKRDGTWYDITELWYCKKCTENFRFPAERFGCKEADCEEPYVVGRRPEDARLSAP